MMRICAFPGCGRKHFGRGWCQGHYRQDRAGEPVRPLRGSVKPEHTCTKHPAGTATCYEQHCRCRQCTDAKNCSVKRIRAGLRHRLDPAGTRRRLQALSALGWDDATIGADMGITSHQVSALRRTTATVRQDTAARVRAVYDARSMVLPPDTWQAARNRTVAARRGWAPPLAWDDGLGPHGIDNPAARPYRGAERGQRTYAEAAEETRALIGTCSAQEIARRLGYADYDSLASVLIRGGHKDLADRYRATKEVA